MDGRWREEEDREVSEWTMGEEEDGVGGGRGQGCVVQSRGCAVSRELVSRPLKTAAKTSRKQQLANRHTV